MCAAFSTCKPAAFSTCKPVNVLLNTESETSGSNQNTDLVTVPGHMAPQLQVLDVVVNRPFRYYVACMGNVCCVGNAD